MELQSTWLFQEFMVALERQVQAACEGSCALPSPPLPAMSFFSVTKNRKVRSIATLPLAGAVCFG